MQSGKMRYTYPVSARWQRRTKKKSFFVSMRKAMKMKKQLLALLLAAVMVLSLTGCKETLKKVAQKVTGHSEEVQEEDTTRWADATADPLIIQGIADASAKFDTAMVDGTLYAVFNGIWSRQTNYFAAPTGTLTVMACGTAEGTQKFKVALWKKVLLLLLLRLRVTSMISVKI